VVFSSFAAKEELVKLRNSETRRADERVAVMLKRHVRNQRGSAAIAVARRTPLRERLDRAA
jgi:hypothetical protein